MTKREKMMVLPKRLEKTEKENQIHPTALIEEGAVIGRDNIIGPNVYIGSNVRIGDHNLISGFASIGMPAEHRDYFHREGEVIIGSLNVIREFTTINSSTKGVTRMGDGCIMLRGSHLSHDSVLEDSVNVSCNVLIGGESHIMRGANLGLGCIIHQRQVIGSYCMIGMGAVITKGKRVCPGDIWVGNPGIYLKPNEIGFKRANVVSLDSERVRFDKLWQTLHGGKN
jgi:UDP-N-acetylglucosamine acyltransferase